MRILIVADSPDWAIGRLAEAKRRFNPHHKVRLEFVHPRDAKEKSDQFLDIVRDFNPDIIQFEYWRTAGQLIEKHPELKEIKLLLTHHNQRGKALYGYDWNALGIHTLVTHTQKCSELLRSKGFENVRVIRHGIDLSYFQFSDKEPAEPAIGYVGRVVAWKGLKEIADAADELGYPVVCMGRIDDADYWKTVSQTNLHFDFMNVPDEERIDAYRRMTIYVGNSKDGYEEGTMPLLEAMASGVPVVTTPSGIAAEIIEDQRNGLVVRFEDPAGLKFQIHRLMEDKDLRARLREAAWDTVKNFTEEKMAREYSKLWNEIVFTEPLVSVIIPFTRPYTDRVQSILEALGNQDHKNIEAVICLDDDFDLGIEAKLEERRLAHPFPIKLVSTEKRGQGYGLAKARNMGVVEAEGKHLVFCDSRMLPQPGAIRSFVDALEKSGKQKKRWYFGDKGGGKRNFVENFSAIRRDHFIHGGMMNERIDRYGGMSQELRERFMSQGFEFEYLEEAKATPMASSHRTVERRADIIASKLKLWKMGL